MDSLWAFAQENGLTFTDDPAEVDPSEGVFARSARAEAAPVLATRMKAYLARNLYGTSAMRPIFNQADPVIQEALALWDRAAELAAFHAEDDAVPASSSEGTFNGRR
jgi:carboxyl-terminal processing protease